MEENTTPKPQEPIKCILCGKKLVHDFEKVERICEECVIEINSNIDKRIKK